MRKTSTIEGDLAEIHIVDDDTVFGDTTQETAVYPSLAKFLKEEVLARLVKENDITHTPLAKEERVEAHLAAGEYLEAIAIVGRYRQQGAEKAALPYPMVGIVAFQSDRVVDKMKIAAAVLRAGEIERDIAYHINKVARRSEIHGVGIGRDGRGGRLEELPGYGDALFDTRFADALAFGFLVVGKIVMELHAVRLTAKPREQALLLPLGLPHSHESAHLVDGGHLANNDQKLLINLAAGEYLEAIAIVGRYRQQGAEKAALPYPMVGKSAMSPLI